MATCEECGEKLVGERGCSYCQGTFCQHHQLPEKHDCPGVKNLDQTGHRFDSGFDGLP
ncbi:AN1-type zinc finger domain-containing protein [Halorussus aquaticus]|uniref:AN1-type zinc finger domain-containing protein n=1 Tax=Halorussus aquaticus TaxID=2953748 RepID=A0ABD5Q5J6_9EURY|nr:AN1-type zinc finger domain-containing protein [Halorussus aquaticus]